MAFIAGIGLTAGIMGIGNNLYTIVGAQVSHDRAKEPTTWVRVTVGMDNVSPDTDMKGDTPGVTLWNHYGQYIGKNSGSGKDIEQGAFVDLPLTHTKERGNQRAEYISISDGGIDATCIAALQVTFPDGGAQVWYGDTASLCTNQEVPWYYSETAVGEDNYRSRCIWVDRDNSYGYFPFQGFSIHLPDFEPSDARVAQYNSTPESMCVPPRFAVYPKLLTQDSIPVYDPPLEYHSNRTDKDIAAVMHPRTRAAEKPHWHNNGLGVDRRRRARFRRDSAKRSSSPFHTEWVVQSTIPEHSATALCASGTSRGPDLLSLSEKLFCHMESKTVLPLCDSETQPHCFDTATNEARFDVGEQDGTELLERDAESSNATVFRGRVKTYTRVLQW